MNYIIYVLVLLIFSVGCKSNPGNEIQDNTVAVSLLYLVKPGAWEKYVPQANSISISIQNSSTKNFSYDPSCSNAPGTDSKYAFFVKKGSSNNLLINFMGGGACWDAKNCLGVSDTQTYISDIGFVNYMAMNISSSYIDAGVLDHNAANNPFKGWTMVFIPYCTGDVFWGSNDYEYTDPVTSEKHTIRHRGFDNFLSVLKYLQNNYPSTQVGDVFVTGQSAGGYGAIYNYPYIKEVYSSNKVYVLGDAANGVTTTTFESDVKNVWGVSETLPDWISGISTSSFDTLDIGYFYQYIGNHYTTTRLAQYTAAYDGTQVYFYNVNKTMGNTYVANSSMWDTVTSDLYCEWNTKMLTLKSTAEKTANYRSFIAYGKVHTISMDTDFYTLSQDGTSLVSWYKKMIEDDSSWNNVLCTSCIPTGTTCQ
ncbi:MAG: hypothetical protein H7A23_04905 [Leptospiraceae bacterium]|nr:hypothetical protein [Leptospiraceae bacterium]MCP5493875.1 hypothetical protein [Leptospiraceae bacterium]